MMCPCLDDRPEDCLVHNSPPKPKHRSRPVEVVPLPGDPPPDRDKDAHGTWGVHYGSFVEGELIQIDYSTGPQVYVVTEITKSDDGRDIVTLAVPTRIDRLWWRIIGKRRKAHVNRGEMS